MTWVLLAFWFAGFSELLDLELLRFPGFCSGCYGSERPVPIRNGAAPDFAVASSIDYVLRMFRLFAAFVGDAYNGVN